MDGPGGQGERWSRCCWGRCGVSSGRGTRQEPPAGPAQPGEARHRVWWGCKWATKASLEGALWASRGSALISWAQRFLSAPTPISPSCPITLLGAPASCIPPARADPCTGSWPSTRSQCGFSVAHGEVPAGPRELPPPLRSPEDSVATPLSLHSAETRNLGSLDLAKRGTAWA